MFEKLQMAPADPILGLTEAFRADSNPDKINLGVGVFQDEDGQTPTLEAVLSAEQRLLEESRPKTYLPISGLVEYGRAVRSLLFGVGHSLVDDGRAITMQAPGGTGALRLAGELMRLQLGGPRLWLSDPTWANHAAIFRSAGIETVKYDYYDPASHGLNFEGMLNSLRQAQPGEVVLLHGCCHNPTGVDPEGDQWGQLVALVRERQLLPLIDFAYQGFGLGLEEDAAGLRRFVEAGCDLLVASSFSKNFGLYNERVGGLTLVASDTEAASRAFSQLKICARTNYSNPPQHGAAVVATILGDSELTRQWRTELDGMRARIHQMRSQLVEGLGAQGVKGDFSFIARQQGMFSFSGLDRDQVQRLRDEHSIYAVGSGRINVAGIRPANLERLCKALAAVL